MGTIQKRSPLELRALDIQDRASSLVDFVGAVPLPAGPVVIDGGGTDWLVLDARIDPLVAKGQLGVPRAARDRLARIAATGVDFDTFLIGHELPAGSTKDLGVKVPSGPTDLGAVGALLDATARDRRAETVVSTTTKTVDAVARWTARAATGAAWAAAGAAAGAASMLAGLDPVIFGAVTGDGEACPGDVAALFHLVHWT